VNTVAQGSSVKTTKFPEPTSPSSQNYGVVLSHIPSAYAPSTVSTSSVPEQSKKGPRKAVALYDFEEVQEGDLPFKTGDEITILHSSDDQEAWWTGTCNGKTGIFPANYIEIIE